MTQETIFLATKKEDKIFKPNNHTCLFQALENIARQIQVFYAGDNLDLTPFFQLVISQINEILEIDRLEIVEVASNYAKRIRAQITNSDLPTKSNLQIPIKVENREWGYLLLESSQTNLILLDKEISFLNQLSLYIAIAIQQKLLKRQKQAELAQRKAIELNVQKLLNNGSNNNTLSDLIARINYQKQLIHLKKENSLLENENTKSKLLADLIQKIRNSLNLEEILVTTVSEVRNSLEVERILIYKILEDGKGKVITESIVPGYSSVLGFNFPEETLPVYCQNRYSKQKYKAITNVQLEYQESYPCLVDFLEQWQVKSKVIVPIINNNVTWGFLIVHQCSYYRQWTELELELLCQLSNQLAIAIKQSELYHQLEIKLQEKQETQLELQTSLKEKEILLKEIHHRVKNNLNVISSLLNLQTNYLEDEQIINMFVDSQNRIRSIALVHEQLYNSTNLSRINFAKYIENLIDNFQDIHNTNSQNIKFILKLMPLDLNLETAIPCGLIINEIITNSCKHAFHNKNSGQIKINLYQEGALYKLEISDNGIGFPQNFDWENTTSLGLRLVNLLSMQLNAELAKKDLAQGTIFICSFTELEYSNRL